jgi:hypothetical protein
VASCGLISAGIGADFAPGGRASFKLARLRPLDITSAMGVAMVKFRRDLNRALGMVGAVLHNRGPDSGMSGAHDRDRARHGTTSKELFVRTDSGEP